MISHFGGGIFIVLRGLRWWQRDSEQL